MRDNDGDGRLASSVASAAADGNPPPAPLVLRDSDDTQPKAKKTTVAWFILIGAGFLEIIWAISMKYSDGFSRLWPTVIGLVTAWLSFVLLAFALKSLPVATAYAVWAGIGAIGTAIVGILFLSEGISLLRLSLLGMIAVGIVGLRVIGG